MIKALILLKPYSVFFKIQIRMIIRELQQQANISYNALRTWRSNIKKDPNWRPNHSRAKNIIFKPETEEEIVKMLEEKYIHPQGYFSVGLLASALDFRVFLDRKYTKN